MKAVLGLFVAALFFAAVSLAQAKDYQVTGPVVDVKDDAIVVKVKNTENWEIARDKDTKTTGEIKKGDRVMVKYKMTATSIESKEAKGKSDTKTKADDNKMKTDTKTDNKAKTK